MDKINFINGQTKANATTINTFQTNIENAINNSIGATNYDSTATYAVGDFCIHSDKLYRCTTAISTAEAWNSAHWTEINLLDNSILITSESSGVVTGANKKIDPSCIYKFEEKVGDSIIKTSYTSSVGPCSAGASGYIEIPINQKTGYKCIGSYVNMSQVSASMGLQLTPVYHEYWSSSAYVNYYAPKAFSNSLSVTLCIIYVKDTLQ